jgi:hypothetical protein
MGDWVGVKSTRLPLASRLHNASTGGISLESLARNPSHTSTSPRCSWPASSIVIADSLSGMLGSPL